MCLEFIKRWRVFSVHTSQLHAGIFRIHCRVGWIRNSLEGSFFPFVPRRAVSTSAQVLVEMNRSTAEGVENLEVDIL